MMPNAIGSNVGAMKPPRLHSNAPANTGSSRSAGTSVTASTPRSMFDQNVPRSGAPGNTAAMPTIAIGSGIGTANERTRIGRGEDHLRVAAAAQLGEQRLDAAFRIDE